VASLSTEEFYLKKVCAVCPRQINAAADLPSNFRLFIVSRVLSVNEYFFKN